MSVFSFFPVFFSPFSERETVRKIKICNFGKEIFLNQFRFTIIKTMYCISFLNKALLIMILQLVIKTVSQIIFI